MFFGILYLPIRISLHIKQACFGENKLHMFLDVSYLKTIYTRSTQIYYFHQNDISTRVHHYSENFLKIFATEVKFPVINTSKEFSKEISYQNETFS